MDNDSVQMMCHYCDRSTIYSKSAIQNELKRLSAYGGFEIMTCNYCSHKFSKSDFEKALGIFKYEDIIKIMDENVNNSTPKTTLYHESEEDLTERLKKIEEENLKQNKVLQDEIKKMQSGEPFDEKIVGPIEMEEGTPQDRRCVRILKKEGEIYAYTFKAIDYIVTNIWESIRYIGQAIWDIIKKINWCILCSAVRIGYFIGYVGLIIYGLIATFVFHEAIFNNNYKEFINSNHFLNTTGASPIWAWTLMILIIFLIPVCLQIAWAFSTPDSRWAKVIKKRADEIIK